MQDLHHILAPQYPGESARYFHPITIGSTPENARY